MQPLSNQVTPSADGTRNGSLRAGTRDFEILTGTVREQFVADVDEAQDIQGRIELVAALIGPLGDGE